jgi:hypothetical protein
MSEQPDKELREKLAAIEHERWADWQQWMHSKMTFQGIGYSLPADLYQRWDRQIATKYADLPAPEQASGMEQVDRYWPLIEEYISKAQLKLVDELMKQTKPVLYVADEIAKKIYSETPYQAIPIEVLQQYKVNLIGTVE